MGRRARKIPIRDEHNGHPHHDGDNQPNGHPHPGPVPWAARASPLWLPDSDRPPQSGRGEQGDGCPDVGADSRKTREHPHPKQEEGSGDRVQRRGDQERTPQQYRNERVREPVITHPVEHGSAEQWHPEGCAAEGGFDHDERKAYRAHEDERSHGPSFSNDKGDRGEAGGGEHQVRDHHGPGQTRQQAAHQQHDAERGAAQRPDSHRGGDRRWEASPARHREQQRDADDREEADEPQLTHLDGEPDPPLLQVQSVEREEVDLSIGSDRLAVHLRRDGEAEELQDGWRHVHVRHQPVTARGVRRQRADRSTPAG